MAIKIELHPVISSNIAAIGYDEETWTLRIRFENGGIYDYAEVPPEVYEDCKGSTSVGKYYYANIRSKYDSTKLPVEPARMTLEEMEAIQRAVYNRRHAVGIAAGEAARFDELSPEEAAAVCIECGDIVDPEMPFDEGDRILCGGDYCNYKTDHRGITGTMPQPEGGRQE